MERDFIREDGSNKLQRISRAYEVLDGLHRRLLGGEVPYPGTLIKFGMNLSDGAQLDITKYDWRLYFRLKKRMEPILVLVFIRMDYMTYLF
jgi:hypothetical protein